MEYEHQFLPSNTPTYNSNNECISQEKNSKSDFIEWPAQCQQKKTYAQINYNLNYSDQGEYNNNATENYSITSNQDNFCGLYPYQENISNT